MGRIGLHRAGKDQKVDPNGVPQTKYPIPKRPRDERGLLRLASSSDP